MYDVSDLMALLQRLQAQPPGNPTVLWLWKNVTLDLATWPTEGYTVSSPLLLVGRSATTHSYIDFQRVPRFIRVVGNLPDMYVYMQWLQLTNLPNALLQVRALECGVCTPGRPVGHASGPGGPGVRPASHVKPGRVQRARGISSVAQPDLRRPSSGAIRPSRRTAGASRRSWLRGYG